MLTGMRLSWYCTGVIPTPMGLLGRPRFCNAQEGLLSQLTSTAPFVLRRVAAGWLIQLQLGAVLSVCPHLFHGAVLDLPQLQHVLEGQLARAQKLGEIQRCPVEMRARLQNRPKLQLKQPTCGNTPQDKGSGRSELGEEAFLGITESEPT